MADGLYHVYAGNLGVDVLIQPKPLNKTEKRTSVVLGYDGMYWADKCRENTRVVDCCRF
jgi:hypothetical protein